MSLPQQEAHHGPPPTAPFTLPPMNPPAEYQYQPYVYTTPPQQAFEAPRPLSNKGWEITKTVFHGLSIVLAIVGIGLAFSTLNYVYFPYTVVIAAAPPCFIALLWSIAELVARAFRKFHLGIHPGAHIALSLIIALVGVVLTSFFGPWFQSSWYGDSISTQTCSYQYDAAIDDYTQVCTDSGDTAAAWHRFDHEKRIAYATAIVTYVIAAIHFTLFVGACVDTSKANAVQRPIYIIAQPQMMHQGWLPIQQSPVQPSFQPAETAARDVPLEEEEQDESSGQEKGKEPAQGYHVVEHYAPGEAQG